VTADFKALWLVLLDRGKETMAMMEVTASAATLVHVTSSKDSCISGSYPDHPEGTGLLSK